MEPMESTRREPNASGVGVTSKQQASLAKTQVEQKQTKAASGDSEKTSKNKENAAAKSKSKNSKLKERNEESGDRKSTEEDGSSVKEKSEISPKNKKEEKLSKRELEKEKQELIKEGFTMVKGPERTKKETRKNEDAKAEDEVEKKRKHAEFMKKQDDFIRKLEQEMEEEKKLEIKYQQQLELEMEKIKKKMKTSSSSKKAPWSAVSGTAAQPSGAADPPTLAEIQRLEREKKFEVIKEQQQMVQLIAQQQQAALAREQELQQTTGYNWTKYKSKKNFENIKSLTEIQEESRQAEMRLRQAQPKPTEEPAPQLPAAAQNHAPWSQNGGSTNLGGFWEAMPGAAGKPEAPRPSKPSSNAPQQQPSNKPLNKKSIKAAKEAPKELPSSKEFETWCNSVLSPWSKKIDVPVFVGFLKDIESPFEVKDYVKCYLGESKDSSDFAKSFLEKRSKLLRVAQATPVDDLCSPAPAKNPPPQTISSDFYELKGKARKVKKNKMLKVDARILGFSVTAAEDRINVGDIDSI